MHFSKLLLLAGAIGSAAMAQEAEAPERSSLDEIRNAQERRAADAPPPAPPPAADTAAPAATRNPPAAAQPPAPPAAPAAAPATLSAAQVATLERTVERGRMLIAIARAGLVATQDMLSRVSDPEGAGIAGWIAEPEGNAMAVTFYANVNAVPRAVYRASVLGPRVVSREVFLGEDRPALTPLQARMAAARAATEGLEHRACSTQPFNVLVVPPAVGTAPIDVYQLSAPAERGRFPVGGHFRSTVAADGAVASSRSFANGCVDVEAAVPAAGEQPRPIGVTHMLDPLPTEVHVLLSQMIGRPLLVATGAPQRVWIVTPDRIAPLRNVTVATE